MNLLSSNETGGLYFHGHGMLLLDDDVGREINRRPVPPPLESRR